LPLKNFFCVAEFVSVLAPDFKLSTFFLLLSGPEDDNFLLFFLCGMESNRPGEKKKRILNKVGSALHMGISGFSKISAYSVF
jgi:hypothetical protein